MADVYFKDFVVANTNASTCAATDSLPLVIDPTGTPLNRELPIGNLFARGTVIDNAPIIDASQTWNDGAVTFTGILANFTDNASAADSTLIDVQLDSVSKVTLGKTTGLYIGTDAANTLAQRNSTSAQAFHLYNTYTNASNYERLAVKWDSNNVYIISEFAGTGQRRNLFIDGLNIYFNAANTYEYRFNIASVTQWRLDGSQFYPNTSDADNIGKAANLVANVYSSVFTAGKDHTVSTLPGTPAVGMIARVTDANSPSIGSTVAGSGAAAALVWYNGSNWTVIGI